MSVVVARVEFEIVAPPLTRLQAPVPLPVGVLAEITAVGELMHSVWLLPALETDGTSSTIMVMVEVVEQLPLVITHASTLVPRARLLTVEAASVALPKLPPPVTTDQLPTPNVGVLPLSVVLGELMQSV